MNTDHLFRRRLLKVSGSLLTAVVALIMIIWLIFGFKSISGTNRNGQLSETKASVIKSVSLCYSIEGRYPPDIDYLKKNYGLYVNTDKYIIEYELIAENITPSVKVFFKN